MMNKILAVLGITAVLFSVFGVFAFASNGTYVQGDGTEYPTQYYQYPDSYEFYSASVDGSYVYSSRTSFENGTEGSYNGNNLGDLVFYDGDISNEYRTFTTYLGRTVEAREVRFRDAYQVNTTDNDKANAVILHYDQFYYHNKLRTASLVFAVGGADLGDGVSVIVSGYVPDSNGFYQWLEFTVEPVTFDVVSSGYAAVSIPLDIICDTLFKNSPSVETSEGEFMNYAYHLSISLQPMHDIDELSGKYIFDYQTVSYKNLNHYLSSTYFWIDGYYSNVQYKDYPDVLEWAFDAFGSVFTSPIFYVGELPISIGGILSCVVGVMMVCIFLKVYSGG